MDTVMERDESAKRGRAKEDEEKKKKKATHLG